ncbi:hypothetical protein TNCV_1047111 [Trichonephila clavipes]|nr:hypothetical protein TNCV_1047111 [Trichonephila clavipes]
MLSSRPGAIYQQDNARPHTARLSQQCLDMTSYHGCQVTRSFANRACLTRWEGNCSRPGDTGELTAQMQKTIGSSTGGHK